MVAEIHILSPPPFSAARFTDDAFLGTSWLDGLLHLLRNELYPRGRLARLAWPRAQRALQGNQPADALERRLACVEDAAPRRRAIVPRCLGRSHLPDGGPPKRQETCRLLRRSAQR